MIKSLSIQNFEAHEDTTISFCDNMNLIVGKSNEGKSALIRALGVVVNNNWTKQMVRCGTEFCRVKVETDKGWVETERGQKVNRWRCQENGGQIQSFKNVGIKVPQLATKILGMGERDRGQIKELPNFIFQLQKHYMLSEIGEKKATSNMIARMMDNAIGLGGMEDLIKALSTDLLKDKKWLTEKQNEITQLKTNILDEFIFNSYEKLVNKINELNESINSIYDNIYKANNFYDKYKNILNNQNNINKLLQELSNIDYLIQLKDNISLLRNKISIFINSYNIFNKLNNIKHLSDKQIDDINNLLNDCNFQFNLIKKCILCNNINLKLEKLNNINKIDMNLINKNDNNILELKEKILLAEKKLFDARNIWKRKSSIDNELNKIIKDINSCQEEFHKLKDKLGICPLCGNKL